MFIRTLGSQMSEYPSTEIRGPTDPSNSENSVSIRLKLFTRFGIYYLLKL